MLLKLEEERASSNNSSRMAEAEEDGGRTRGYVSDRSSRLLPRTRRPGTGSQGITRNSKQHRNQGGAAQGTKRGGKLKLGGQ